MMGSLIAVTAVLAGAGVLAAATWWSIGTDQRALDRVERDFRNDQNRLLNGVDPATVAAVIRTIARLERSHAHHRDAIGRAETQADELRDLIHRLLAELEVRPPAHPVVAALHTDGPLTLTELVTRFGAGAVAMLEPLLDAGLVECVGQHPTPRARYKYVAQTGTVQGADLERAARLLTDHIATPASSPGPVLVGGGVPRWGPLAPQRPTGATGDLSGEPVEDTTLVADTQPDEEALRAA
jgi:hypothetical protein